MSIESKGVIMEEVKRSNNGIFIAIIIVLLAVIAGLLFMILNKDNNKKNPNNKEEIVETEKEEKVDQELVNNLIEIFNHKSCNISFPIKADQTYVDYSSMDDYHKYGIVLEQITGVEVEFYKYAYNGKQLDEKYYELFGYDKKIELKNISKSANISNRINANGLSLYYDKELNNYYGDATSGCGSGIITGVVYKVIDTNLKEDILEITFKFAKLREDGNSEKVDIYNANTNDIIDNIDCKTDTTNSICAFTNNDYNKDDLTELVMSKYSDKLNNYKFTFKYDKEHDNYYFYSLERLK